MSDICDKLRGTLEQWLRCEQENTPLRATLAELRSDFARVADIAGQHNARQQRAASAVLGTDTSLGEQVTR
jgi:demethoxyubiquinone hydroxylase (CLK1/Coq7/Cat5 family)